MDFVTYMLGCAELIIFAWGVTQMEFCKSKRRILAGVFFMLFYSIMMAYLDNGSVFFLILMLIRPFISCILLFDEKLIKCMVKAFFCDSYVGFTYYFAVLAVTVVCQIFNFDLPENWERIPAYVLSIVFIYMLSRILAGKPHTEAWIREIPMSYFIVAGICGNAVNGICACVDYIMKNAREEVRILSGILRVILSFAIYMLAIGFVMADTLRKRYKEENRIQTENLRISREHYADLIAYTKEIREIKHDMDAHINMIGKYVDEENLPMLKEYVNRLKKNVAVRTGQYYRTGNETVDAVITDRMRKCNDKEVVFECKGKLEPSVKIDDFDLCIIFSNLMSNAIEACERLVNTGKNIYMFLESNANQVKIAVENPVEWEVDVDGIGTYTSKQNKEEHGFGVNNIRKCIEKYGGKIFMTCDKGIFRTLIVVNYSNFAFEGKTVLIEQNEEGYS